MAFLQRVCDPVPSSQPLRRDEARCLAGELASLRSGTAASGRCSTTCADPGRSSRASRPGPGLLEQRTDMWLGRSIA